ncbi:hypothetical protein BSK49_01010 [Paenibacillus odorifer]|uniref:hypothetical protein n=1 Tax=Paenibacillus odorifer TaxID=189426 RepID=UPI00096D3874|nr:hypothetical protein [Paenibacillus odorifer]OMD92995.1 hypothetical protein BSK49_01010 [Paenibacillus odorifer]
MLTCQQIIARRRDRWEEHRNIETDKEFREATAQYLIDNPAARAEVRDHPEYLIELLFVIVDKDKQTVPYFLNDAQALFLEKLNTAIVDFKAGRRLHLKFLVLKGRQQGFTSFITAYQLACTITRKNFEGFTAADEDSNATVIFENKAKYPYGALPDSIKPTEKFNNRKQLLFDKLHSSWEIKTASKNMGRSRTINFFHGSEVAFWKDGISGVQAGLGEALTKDAIQIYESTANGYNEYKDLWDSGSWENCFFAWWLTSEYRMHFESTERETWFRVQVAAGSGERAPWIWERCYWLLNTIGLDMAQVYWYYVKWEGYIDKEKIKQEYPCSPHEAFLASGRCVFDQEKLVMRIEYLKRVYKELPPRRGSFRFKWNDAESQDRILDESIEWVDQKDGFITLYEDTRLGYPYVIGGDTKGEGKDKYAGTVINNITGKRCATLHMELSNSKPFTWQMYCMGRYFNSALIGVEMNFNTAPIEELERLKYPKQYVRQKYDSMGKPAEKKFGWKTDGNTRPLIIDKEIDLIEHNIQLFQDIIFLQECLTFVYDDKGRPDAESGKHDDILISDMIANEIRSQQSFIVSEVVVEAKPLPFPFQGGNDDNNEGGYLVW